MGRRALTEPLGLLAWADDSTTLLSILLYPTSSMKSRFLLASSTPRSGFVFCQQDTKPNKYALMELMRPKETQQKSHPKIFVHKDLESTFRVFLRIDRVRKPLEPPYDVPYFVISRTPKYFTLRIKNKEVNVTIDRLKPAYLLPQENPEEQLATPTCVKITPASQPAKIQTKETVSQPDLKPALRQSRTDDRQVNRGEEEHQIIQGTLTRITCEYISPASPVSPEIFSLTHLRCLRPAAERKEIAVSTQRLSGSSQFSDAHFRRMLRSGRWPLGHFRTPFFVLSGRRLE
ncbi:hypothetical protein HNY73_013638 [Argiope bruennichi]|uniref:Uncharacterized protein n=1 Tax=Argiope bruennichi TaxID=94029 RepID=A0A8T0F0H0_ARGBR|nr:hypothetical protein HNY73_013638 [Argiope bruennichi]